MSKLVIVVPANRRRCGRALLFAGDGETRFGPFRVLATASGWAAKRHHNDARDWRRPFGHPPAGSYVVGGFLPPGMTPRPRRLRRFGALGALVLTPVAGDALEAATAGRKRFLLHGGPTDRRGRLRPTFGGFRVTDRDLGGLVRAINEANAAFDAVSTVEVVETTDRPPWTDDGPRDRAGRLRPALLPPRRQARPHAPLTHAALIALGFGIAGKSLRADGSPGRRGFVGLAVLTLGALGATACSGPESPSPDDRVPADPRIGAPASSGSEQGAGVSEGGLGEGSAEEADAAGGGPREGGGGDGIDSAAADGAAGDVTAWADGAGDDGGGPDGGYAEGGSGGDDLGGGGGGTGSGDDTGDDSSGGSSG